jgi:uncharacterized protein YndB with AHSA1/START domain
MSQTHGDPAASGTTTIAERISDREMMVTRSFDAPAAIVFQAWANPELFRQWWVPKSFGITLLSCEMDVRVGGTYRLAFGHAALDQPMAFFGSYSEVIPDRRIVWTNEESADGAITTVTFAEQDGRTVVVVRDLYPSKDVLDGEIASGATGGLPEQLAQLEGLLVRLVAP